MRSRRVHSSMAPVKNLLSPPNPRGYSRHRLQSEERRKINLHGNRHVPMPVWWNIGIRLHGDWAPSMRFKRTRPNQFSANVNYAVDPSESWPGIYYSKVNGGCPLWWISSRTKLPTEGICRPGNFSIRSLLGGYESLRLEVYYQKINGSCSLGGTHWPRYKSGFCPQYSTPIKEYFIRASPAHPGVYYNPKAVRKHELNMCRQIVVALQIPHRITLCG